jgi:thymidylate synthase ThyX
MIRKREEPVDAMQVNHIKELRDLMGTSSIDFKGKGYDTKFWRGVEGISVKLIGYSDNPYKDIYTLATSCWGYKIDKWQDTKPEGRFLVVKAVLERQTLPLALEAPQFTFAVENLSRWAFDQLARQRLGVVFSSMGTRDNDHRNIGFRVHEAIWRNEIARGAFMRACLRCKAAYVKILEQGKGSWQTARSVLPISCIHRYSFAANYAALQNMCAQRMKFCEAEDVVAVAWLVREAVKKEFPLLAHYLRSGCDISNRCDYHKAYTLSEAFGCLFKSCGRWKVENDDMYSQFNESCSDAETIAKQLGIDIPSTTSREWMIPPQSIEELDELDAIFFRNGA